MVYLPLIAGAINLLTDGGNRQFAEGTRYRWMLPAILAGWSGSEMIRLFIPVAGTWAFIAYPLYRQVWLIQPASIFGIIGVGALIMLINGTLTLALMYWLDTRWQGDPDTPPIPLPLVRNWSIGSAAALSAWILLSLFLLRPMDTPKVTVAAIQPEISPILTASLQGEDAQDALAKVHADMLEQSRQAAAQGAQFIVWSEGALLFDPQVEDRLNLRAFTAETGAHLAVGYIVVLPDKTFRNEATVLNPQSEFLGVFGKDHPVVFGGETSVSRGTYPVYDTPLGTLGTIICYDLDYTDTARKLARQGAQLIAVPSNDWSSIADKHYTHVVFRAIENRVAMVKADGGYDSAIIDPYGNILALAAYPEGGSATLVAQVPIGDGKGTLNSLLGDWVGWLALAAMIFFAVGGKKLEQRN